MAMVLLVYVGNTLAEAVRIQVELKTFLKPEFDSPLNDQEAAILEEWFDDLGYGKYLGARHNYSIN